MNTPRSDENDGRRFLKKVLRNRFMECWEYIGFVDKNGYGQFWSNGKTVMAHRFSYELYIGKIPEGLTVDHLCKNTSCVNPAHMELVTLSENSLRNTTSQNNLKKTHCLRGHPFSKENTYIHKTTKERVCRKCKALLGLRYKYKNNEPK